MQWSRRQRLWGGLVGAGVVLVGVVWGVQYHRAKQEREVVAPQRLLTHLYDVRAGQAKLTTDEVLIAALRDREIDQIRTELMADIEATDHPDPEAAVDQLLPSATAYLRTEQGALSALAYWMGSLPEGPWPIRVKRPDHWTVQAGDYCLLLEYQGDDPDVHWQWTAVQDCPDGSAEAAAVEEPDG